MQNFLQISLAVIIFNLWFWVRFSFAILFFNAHFVHKGVPEAASRPVAVIQDIIAEVNETVSE